MLSLGSHALFAEEFRHGGANAWLGVRGDQSRGTHGDGGRVAWDEQTEDARAQVVAVRCALPHAAGQLGRHVDGLRFSNGLEELGLAHQQRGRVRQRAGQTRRERATRCCSGITGGVRRQRAISRSLANECARQFCDTHTGFDERATDVR